MVCLSIISQTTADLFSNSFLVRFTRDLEPEEAHEVAKRHGFVNMGPVSWYSWLIVEKQLFLIPGVVCFCFSFVRVKLFSSVDFYSFLVVTETIITVVGQGDVINDFTTI